MIPQLEADVLEARDKHGKSERRSTENQQKYFEDLQAMKLENSTLNDRLQVTLAELQSASLPRRPSRPSVTFSIDVLVRS